MIRNDVGIHAMGIVMCGVVVISKLTGNIRIKGSTPFLLVLCRASSMNLSCSSTYLSNMPANLVWSCVNMVVKKTWSESANSF